MMIKKGSSETLLEKDGILPETHRNLNGIEERMVNTECKRKNININFGDWAKLTIKNNSGFTLIELVVVIAIISAGVWAYFHFFA